MSIRDWKIGFILDSRFSSTYWSKKETRKVHHPAAAATTTYIQTTTNSYVSRAAWIEGPKFVELKGRSVVQAGARLRGDRAPIRIGRYCLLDNDCAIEPPSLPSPSLSATSSAASEDKEEEKHIPVTIGAHTVIGAQATIQAAAIGSMCWIGKNVQVGPRCIVKDCCVVADGTVIPADTVVPPFHRVFMGEEGWLCTMELPPSVAVELQERATIMSVEFQKAERRC